MDEARIYIDFNERVDGNVFLLSKDDSKVDSKGNTVTFYEDMPLRIWSDDLDDEGNPDNLLADVVAVKVDLSEYSSWSHVKWCCKVDMNTLIHESERCLINRGT